VQVYSAMVYHGPALVGRINRGLVRLLERYDLKHISEAVGRAL
jgi:dihydroorotate dehydrogenase